ncbi:MAG: bifunctional riboflavin kinase/FAD synthetase [Thermodesulfovibrionales bacterium]|nr:bifunctional riboflavin kinase/FAD synthetase [Thermodesulfovibrionales bacterium]
MKIISNLDESFELTRPVATIGNFDGVHIGHRKIFQRAILKAKEINGTPIAISFDPHPVKVLTPERGLKMLTLLDDKVKLLSALGLKALIVIPFDRKFSQTEPDDFIKNILIDKLQIKWLVVGHNFSFGKRKKGNTMLLRRRAKKYGFGFTVVRYAKINSNIVSSSRLRTLIQRGKVSEASVLLGRAYHIKGTVVKGSGRGTTLLNVPTANLQTMNEIIPKDGVYAVRVSLKDCHINEKNLVNVNDKYQWLELEGVLNIGNNPTFGDIFDKRIEVHLFDFDKNIVGKELYLHFIERIRDEKRYSNIDALKEQIERDIGIARKILKSKKPPLFCQAVV